MDLKISSFVGPESDEEKKTSKKQKAGKRMEWVSSTGYKPQKTNSGCNERVGKKEDVCKGKDEKEDKEKVVEVKLINRTGISVEIMDGDNKVKISEEPEPLNLFKDLSSPLLKVSLGREYTTPTVIQKYCIRPIIDNRDLICRAPTGMGKTMCFLIPIIEKYKPQNNPQACIVSPTRELCEQIKAEAMKLVVGTRIRVVSIYGKKQDLSSYSGVDIIVATPGRLLDLLKRKRIEFCDVKIFVLDEADKLLDMGFEVPIKEIRGYVPKNVQTCLFSATYSPKLTKVINYFLPGSKVSIEIMSETLRSIKQEVIEVSNKKSALLGILRGEDINLKGSWRAETQSDKVLVFVERKSECGEVEKVLKKHGISCVTLHGDKEQTDRNEALKGFRDGLYPVMVATSVAARGIDVKDIKLVINYDIPKDIKEYIHRIGRTGREGKIGKSVSFYDSSVSKEIKDALVNVLKESKNRVPDFLNGSMEDFNDRFERLKIVADKEVSDNEEIGLW